jgi:hypothetical protein
MDEKLLSIKTYLEKSFPEGVIGYQETGESHEFRVNLPGRTHWLVIDHKTIEDRALKSLYSLLNAYQVIDTFEKNEDSLRLLLMPTGICELERP